jgi:DNA-binding response OmpR family regulator
MPTVLIADDDANIRRMIRVNLEAEGFQVFEASDGREALDLIRENHPDVALIDVRMPQVDGFAVLRELSARGESAQRVLLVTGAVDEDDFIRGWGLGADGYISKPFEPADLMAAVQEVISRTPQELAVRREREIERARLLRQLDRFLDE